MIVNTVLTTVAPLLGAAVGLFIADIAASGVGATADIVTS